MGTGHRSGMTTLKRFLDPAHDQMRHRIGMTAQDLSRFLDPAHDQMRVTAHHEAGHVAGALIVGARISRSEIYHPIDVSDERPYLGVTFYSDALTAAQHSFTAFCGPAAEAHHRRVPLALTIRENPSDAEHFSAENDQFDKWFGLLISHWWALDAIAGELFEFGMIRHDRAAELFARHRPF